MAQAIKPLAYATTDHLAEKISAKTLFATHYFELTELADQTAGLVNVHLDAIEHNDTIAFMHTVLDGAASKSFGLQVAALAGVPKAVINKAKQKLKSLESHQSQSTQLESTQNIEQQTFAFNNDEIQNQHSEVEEQLTAIDPDNLSPRQAHELLYKLKALL